MQTALLMVSAPLTGGGRIVIDELTETSVRFRTESDGMTIVGKAQCTHTFMVGSYEVVIGGSVNQRGRFSFDIAGDSVSERDLNAPTDRDDAGKPSLGAPKDSSNVVLPSGGATKGRPSPADWKYHFQNYSGEMRFVVLPASCGAEGKNFLFAYGFIDIGSAMLLDQKLKEVGPVAVFFHSPGGLVDEALQMGRILRMSNVTVYSGGELKFCNLESNAVEAFLPRTICASACAYAFLGGVKRVVFTDDSFGVHQFNNEMGIGSISDIQRIMSMLGLYLREMGVERELLDVAASDSQMIYLSRRRLTELRVIN